MSCAKLKNVDFIENHSVISCNKSAISDNDCVFFNAIERMSDDQRKIDVSLIIYILKQKDTIVKELHDKIKILTFKLIY